jgi:hypothetical protein
MSVAEIESAIAQLPPRDFAELIAWLQKYRARAWDQQIEDDLESGRLDKFIAEAKEEYKQGLARPPSLDDVYAILGRRHSSGQGNVAARHDEQQPN